MPGRFWGGGGGSLLQKKQSPVLFEIIRYAGIQIVRTAVKAVWIFFLIFMFCLSAVFYIIFFPHPPQLLVGISNQFHIDLLGSAWLLMLKNALFHLKFAIWKHTLFQGFHRSNTIANKTFMKWYSRKAVKYIVSVNSFLNIYQINSGSFYCILLFWYTPPSCM